MQGNRREAFEKLAGGILLVGGTLNARFAAAQTSATTPTTAPELRLLGVLATAGLQNAWLLLDVTAQSWKEQGLSDARVRGVADAVVRQLALVSRGLQSLDPNRLEEVDQEFVEQARRCCRSLQLAARGLVRWLDRPSVAESRTFERALRSALDAIQELTGEPESSGASSSEE